MRVERGAGIRITVMSVRVCHVTVSSSSLGGGISIAVQALAGAQAQAGLGVRVVGLSDGGTVLAGWPEGMLREVASKKVPGMRWGAGLGDVIEEGKPEVVHSHGLWSQPSIAVRRQRTRRGTPYVVSPHGMLDGWALAHSRWKKLLAGVAFERRHLREAACLHALCRPEAVSIRDYGARNPIAVIPNGVDLPSEEGVEIERREGGRKTLLFLGRLHPKKGLAGVLEAWAALGSRAVEGWRLEIAGWDQGGHEAELKRLASDLGVGWADVRGREGEDGRGSDDGAASVVFSGPAFGGVKDGLLRRADAFILPSFSEGLPMSVLEAWAYRLPVLMTDYCNLPEGFAAGAARRIGTDAESIGAGLRALFAETGDGLREMGGKGRALVESRFTWRQVAEQMGEVYRWVLGNGLRPSCVEVQE